MLLIYAVASVFATTSLLINMPGFRYGGLVIVLFCAVSWIGVQHLGYAEFTAARRVILSGTVRQLIASQTKLRSYRWALERAVSISECWLLTVEAMRDLGFDRMEMVLPSGERFDTWLHDQNENPNMQDCWTVKIPFGPPLEDGWLEVSRHIDRGEGYLMLHDVVQTVREVFPKKVLEQRVRAAVAARTGTLEAAGPAPAKARATTAAGD